jgi:hypothetical protein
MAGGRVGVVGGSPVTVIPRGVTGAKRPAGSLAGQCLKWTFEAFKKDKEQEAQELICVGI